MQNVFTTPGPNSLDEIADEPLKELDGGERELDRELARNRDERSYMHGRTQVPSPRIGRTQSRDCRLGACIDHIDGQWMSLLPRVRLLWGRASPEMLGDMFSGQLHDAYVGAQELNGA